MTRVHWFVVTSVLFLSACGDDTMSAGPDASADARIDATIDARIDAAVDAPGTDGASDASPTADAAGSCGQPSDCPATGNPCSIATCLNNVCGTSFVAAGTVVTNPVVGDCRSNQCDGNGNVTTDAVDNTDVPADDGNQCTGESCSGGVPSHPNSATGTACNQGGGTLCNGAGACVQCLAPSDCGADTACQQRTCNGGTCGTNNVAAGTVVSNPVAGDCHSNQCDGNGNITTNAIDNTDVPVDGNQCTADVCSGGVPSNPNLPTGTACNQNGGVQCDGAGACL